MGLVLATTPPVVSIFFFPLPPQGVLASNSLYPQMSIILFRLPLESRCGWWEETVAVGPEAVETHAALMQDFVSAQLNSIDENVLYVGSGGWPLTCIRYTVYQSGQGECCIILSRAASSSREIVSNVHGSQDVTRVSFQSYERVLAFGFKLIPTIANAVFFFILVTIGRICLETRIQKRRRARNECVSCKYSLSGTTGPTCPECGCKIFR